MKLLKKYKTDLTNHYERTTIGLQGNMILDDRRLMIYVDRDGEVIWDTGLVKGSLYNRHLKVLNYLVHLLRIDI